MIVTDTGHLKKLRALISPEAERAIAAGLERTADGIVDETRENLNDGAISGIGHVPGPPGGYSKSDTHELEESLHRGVTEETGDTISTSAAASAEHGLYQELGTSKVAPRPNLHLATIARGKDAVRYIADGLAEVMRQA